MNNTNETLMIKVVKTLRYTFDLTTDEFGMVRRKDNSVISHESNFLMIMKLRHVINGDAYQEENATDWTQAQRELGISKVVDLEQSNVQGPVTPAPGDHGPNGEFKTILTRGGRTGRKIHLASDGGSGSYCGHWFKAHTSHFKVADDTPENRAKYHRHLCTKCFSEKGIANAVALATK